MPCPKSVDVKGLDDITIDNIVIRDVKCNGTQDGAVTYTVTGGTGAYTYDWKRKAADGTYSEDVYSLASATIPVGNEQNLSQVKGGDYQVTITSRLLQVLHLHCQ